VTFAEAVSTAERMAARVTFEHPFRQEPFMTDTAAPPEARPNLRWYQGVPRYAWLVLFICALGWLFDTMDQHLFNLVRQPSVAELLKGHVPADKLDAAAKDVGGQLTAVFLIGWACGGFFFGMLGDKLGRTRTMMITILIYAVFTGMNGLVNDPMWYGICRFLTALGVGGEFAAGASLVAEVWPERSRPMALGFLQALSAVGNITAGFIVLGLATLSWRYVYYVGAIPAIVVVAIRFFVKEPDRWIHARDEARKAPHQKEMGSIAALFHDPVLKRNTIAGVLLALAGVGGVWGVGFFLPDLVGTVLKPIVSKAPHIVDLVGAAQEKAIKADLARLRGWISITQQVGAFIGIFAYAVVSERIGRKPALLIAFVLAFVTVQATFWGLKDITSAYALAFFMGFGALMPFGAYCVYFPELYPTRLRSTGVGFCYNCARILAAAAPFALGKLTGIFQDPTDATHGFRVAASIVACIYVAGIVGLFFAPETRGRPLPE
jgi:MFS family permease